MTIKTNNTIDLDYRNLTIFDKSLTAPTAGGEQTIQLWVYEGLQAQEYIIEIDIRDFEHFIEDNRLNLEENQTMSPGITTHYFAQSVEDCAMDLDTSMLHSYLYSNKPHTIKEGQVEPRVKALQDIIRKAEMKARFSADYAESKQYHVNGYFMNSINVAKTMRQIEEILKEATK